MTTVNVITPPDKLYNDNINILLVFPGNPLQNDLQSTILNDLEYDINLYVYNKMHYDKEEVDWLLSVFLQSDIVVIDIDNCEPFVRDLISFMLGKSKTYWLTNAVDTVYNHISKNRIYNLATIKEIGDKIGKESIR